MGLLRALLDGIAGEDNLIAGSALSRLAANVAADGTTISVESTIGFGEVTDNSGDALLAIDGEIIYASGRTISSFTGCTRAEQNTPAAVHPKGALVFDVAQNSSGLDLVRRGILVETAAGEDLDVIGRNLGMHRCPGLTESQYRTLIQAVAYAPKQVLPAFRAALDAIYPNAYVLYERLLSSPLTVFVRIDVPAARDLRGRFFLNGGEPVLVSGGTLSLRYPVQGSPFNGAVSRGRVRLVSGRFLNDGETVVLDDGTNPAITFEFDSDGSVIETSTLKAVNFTAADSESAVRTALINAISGGTFAIQATAATSDQCTALLTDNAGLNVAITTTVLDPVFEVEGFSGGQPGDSEFGVFCVIEDNARTRQGYRDAPYTRYEVSGYVDNVVSLVAPPIDGTPLLVDYTAFRGHYLPPNVVFRNHGADFPPYFADNLQTARCALELVRMAGVAVNLGIRNFI